MRLHRRFVIVAALLVAPGVANAQDRLLAAVGYSMAFPTGDTERYAPGTSFSGFSWEWRSYIRPHTSIGVSTGFNEFHKRNGGTFDFPRGAITGEQYRHLLVVPLLATGAWYFKGNRNDPRWYLGGGIGTRWVQQLLQLGLAERVEDGWDFVVAPEAGLAFKMWYGTGGIVSLRYQLPVHDERLLAGFHRFQYFSLSFGIGLRETDTWRE